MKHDETIFWCFLCQTFDHVAFCPLKRCFILSPCQSVLEPHFRTRGLDKFLGGRFVTSWEEKHLLLTFYRQKTAARGMKNSRVYTVYSQSVRQILFYVAST